MKYDIPLVKKQNIDVEKIKFISYSNTKNDDIENNDKTVHFFTYDRKIEKVYLNPNEELQKLSRYYALLTPDFSVFTNMPRALQNESVFKNRWCGVFNMAVKVGKANYHEIVCENTLYTVSLDKIFQ